MITRLLKGKVRELLKVIVKVEVMVTELMMKFKVKGERSTDDED